MYIPPTVADIKARYPEFEKAPDTLIAAILAEVEPTVGPRWLERDRRQVVMLLVAHKLASEGRFGPTMGSGAGGVTTGPMKRRKVGDVEVEYAGNGSSSGGGSGGELDSLYGSTFYGREYLILLRRNFRGMLVI